MTKTVSCVEVMPMPQLLSSLTCRNNSIKYGYQEKLELPEQSEGTRKTPRKLSVMKEDSDLDLTGSPLKTEFDVNQVWNLSNTVLDGDVEVKSYTGPVYKGASLSESRGWLSKEDISHERWALIDSKGEDRTVFLGSRYTKDTQVLSSVTWREPAPFNAYNSQLGLVLANHERSGGNGTNLKTGARAEYCITGADGVGSSLTVVSSWNRVANLLEPPPLDASTHLNFNIVPGDQKLATSQLWTELTLLEGLAKGLKGEGVTWVIDSRNDDMDILIDEMMDLVRSTGPRMGVTKMESESMMDQGSESFNTINLDARQEVDFTDILWSTLSKVQSYKELVDSFRSVFHTIVTQEIRPFVYARNDTKVARLVSELVRGESMPDLSGSLPLEMLIECGLEKLRRDYSHTLLNNELAAKEAVSQFLLEETSELAVSMMSKLHTVVELTALSQTFLSLPTDVLRFMINSALQTLSSSNDSCLSFNFSIPTQALREQLSQLRPTNWQVKLTSVLNDMPLCLGVDTTARIMVDVPNEIQEFIAAKEQNDDGDRTNPDYVMFVLTEIKRKMINSLK